MPDSCSQTSLKGQQSWDWCRRSGSHCWGVSSMTLSLPSQEKKGIESPFPWELLRAEVWSFLPPFIPPEWCHGDKGGRMHQEPLPVELRTPGALERREAGREASAPGLGAVSRQEFWFPCPLERGLSSHPKLLRIENSGDFHGSASLLSMWEWWPCARECPHT